MATKGKPPGTEEDITVKDAQALPDPAAAGVTVETPVADAPGEDVGADTDDDAPGAPPDADVVALRALAIGTLLRRLEMEERTAPLREIEALQSWADEHGLFSHFAAGAFELIDAPPSEWTEEDRQAVRWTAEELHLLRWALGQAPLPPVFARTTAEVVLADLPLLALPDTFTSQATRRALEDIEAQQVFEEVLYDAAQAEAWARSVAAAPAASGNDPDLEELLQGAAQDGFERERVTREQGAQAAAAAGLRWWAGQQLQPFFEPGSAHASQAFDPAKLASLDDDALGLLLATSRLRSGTLAWLTEGDDWDDDDASAP